MKSLLIILLSFLAMTVFGQDYPFAKTFVDGNIILKDSTQKAGQLKWFPHQNEKLRFKESGNSDTKKYSPGELLGFNVDTLKFVSLFDFEAFADNYALSGKLSKIKQTFGQLLDSGSYNIYLVLITGYNAISGSIQTYPNFLFEKKLDSGYQFAAYPFAIRMKDKKYENAKENLYIFFKDYSNIIDKVKFYNQQDDFFEIINLMKNSN